MIEGIHNEVLYTSSLNLSSNMYWLGVLSLMTRRLSRLTLEREREGERGRGGEGGREGGREGKERCGEMN